MRLRLGIGLMSVLTVAACTQAPLPSSPQPSVPGGTDSPRPTTTAAVSGARPAVTTGPTRPTTQATRPTTRPTRPTGPTTRPTATGASGSTARLAATVVLNPGHNGGNSEATAAIDRLVPAGFGQSKPCDTTGTETNAGSYPEHAFTWDVSLRVRTLLQARGVTVIMTRSSDTGVGPCVDERARIGNQAGVAAVVSIHADGAAVDGHGFHVEECSRQPAGASIAASSHSLTVAEHDALLHGSGLTVSSYLATNGYLPRDDLAGLNLATVPATFLEIGNMRNAGDAAVQMSPIGRQRIAQAVATGILNWLDAR